MADLPEASKDVLFNTIKSVIVVASASVALGATLWGCAVEPIRRDIDRLVLDQRNNMADMRAENNRNIENLKDQINERLNLINRMFEIERSKRGDSDNRAEPAAPAIVAK